MNRVGFQNPSGTPLSLQYKYGCVGGEKRIFPTTVGRSGYDPVFHSERIRVDDFTTNSVVRYTDENIFFCIFDNLKSKVRNTY